MQTTRRVLTAAVVTVLVCGVSAAVVADSDGHSEPVPPAGVVALINRSAPADDIYASQFCTGTLIAPTVVLTAGHCLSREEPGRMDVVVGANNLCRPSQITGERIHVRRFARPPQNSQWSPDVVAVILASPASEPPAPVAAAAPGHDVDAYGWSSTTLEGGRQCHVRQIRLTQLQPGECDSAITDPKNWSPSKAEMLCAVPARIGIANTCHGDSGGPVFANGSVVAITISGAGCKISDPGAYLRTDALSAWLDTVVSSPTVD